MNIIPLPGYPANQFWVATRMMEAVIFLTGFSMLGRKRQVNTDLLFLIYLSIASLIAASIMYWQIFPVCFIPGVGQTPFKVSLEYIIVLLLIISLGLLYRKRENFEHKTYLLLTGSILFAILSECCFATYTTNFGPLNEWGHYGKLISFFLIYKANVEMAFARPMESIFRELKASETEYKTLAENLPGIILRYDAQLSCIYSNQKTDQSNVQYQPDVHQLSSLISEQLKSAIREHQTITSELEVQLQDGQYYYSYQIIPERTDKSQGSQLLVIFRDITSSRKEKLYLTTLLDTIPQHVWTARADGSIDYVNGVVSRDFAAETPLLLSQGWQHYLHPEDVQQSNQAWADAVKYGREYQVQFRLKMAGGEYLWHLGRAVPIRENGEVILWIGTNTNIDAQKKGQEQRDEFISVASHELKTPLTSIKAFNQLLLRTEDPAKVKSYVQKVEVSTTKLERLINDMLDVSRITAGRLQFNKSTFSLNELLEECSENLQLSTITHQIVIEVNDTAIVHADRFRLEQVITNLIGNAIKYSPQADKIIIQLNIEKQGVIIAVKDYGIGIESSELEKLFDRYYRSDNAAMRFGGLGLGLFISSEIIKAHRGTFWIESELGAGTTVFFRIPLNEQKPKRITTTGALSYQDEYLSISCNTKNAWMEVNWKGHQSVESVQNGGLQMIEVLKASGLKKVLNDNREVLGNWSEASEWAGKVWFPLMIEAGLEHFAWVFSPSIFAQLAAQKSFDSSDGKANVRFFHDITEASQWLDAQENGNSCQTL